MLLYIVPEGPWKLLKPPEMIYKTPGHPSERKKRLFSLLNSWESWLWEDAWFFICQQQCVDVFWQCCLWLMGSSVECILLLCCRSDGAKSDNLADRTRSFRPGYFSTWDTVVCVVIKCVVPSLTLCVSVCVFVCVPGPFHQRTQLWMRMMCTGAWRSWQSKYYTTNTHTNAFLSLRRNLWRPHDLLQP